MHTTRRAGPQLTFALFIASWLALVGCVASESVTISESAVAAATTTAGSVTAPTTAVTAEEPTVVTQEDAPTPTETAQADTTAPTAVAPSTTGTSDSACRFDYVDDFGDIQIVIQFTSDLTEQTDANVDYALFDGSGAPIASTSTYIEDLKPGERVNMAIDTVEDAPADTDGITCQYLGIEPFEFGPDPFRPQSGDSCRFVEVDSFDDIQVVIDLENPASTTTELAVDFALRGPDGVRFGDGVAYTDSAEPGERVVQDADTFTELPSWVNQASFSCEILAIEEF